MIYLDNAATGKVNVSALQYAMDYYQQNYYNPSALYKQGVKISGDIDKIKNEIALFFGSDYEVVFTSCGTESDNMVLNHFSKRGNIVISAGEHSAIFECAKKLTEGGRDVRIAKILPNGQVDEKDLLSLVDQNTKLVSVIHLNNETGAINDVESLAYKCKQINSDLKFHSDGVQAFLKTPIRLSNVDFYSVSGHKIGAIKGIGALIKKKGVHISPLIVGGGQEKGLRSGTENVFGIMTFYKAFSDQKDNVLSNIDMVNNLKSIVTENLTENAALISDDNCSPYIIGLYAQGLKSEVIVHMLEDEGILIGMGSACSKNSDSRVLTACGYPKNALQGALRISFGFDNTKEETEYFINKLNDCVKRLKRVMHR